MKKLIPLILSAAALLLAGCDFYGPTTTLTTAEPPATVTIATVDELLAIGTTDHYLLASDLDLGGLEWIPVGTPEDPFSGDFDGQGYTISNFTITHVNAGFLGFFGSVTGNLKNLTVADFTIDVATTAFLYAGGLVAHTTGSIEGCIARGAITIDNTASNTYVGLLAGFAASYTTSTMTLSEFVASAVTDSRAEGTIDVTSAHYLYVGGLIGKTYNLVLADCAAVATITAATDGYRLYAGGLVGHNYGGILKEYADRMDDVVFETVRCYADLDLTVTARGTKAAVGGLYGYNQDGAVEDCFANATIVVAGALIDVGGLTGELWYGTVTSSVARVDLTVLVAEDQTVGYGGVAGSLWQAPALDAVYAAASGLYAVTNTEGAAVNPGAFTAASWYQDVLGWTAETFDLGIVIGILS